MKEQDRQRIIRQKLARMEPAGTRFGPALSTGFATLDSALGTGGLPRGSIIELFGPASSGKSTLAMQTVSHVMEAGCSAAWIDAEHVFDPSQAARLGVPVERLPLARPDTAEQALEIARRLVISGALDLLVIDSAAALVPRLELATGIGQGAHSLHSRVVGSGLRTLSAAAQRFGSVVLVLNQTRSRPGKSAGDDEISAGGPALKLYAAIRLAMEAPRRGTVAFRILKNKAGKAFQEGVLRWENDGKFAKTP